MWYIYIYINIFYNKYTYIYTYMAFCWYVLWETRTRSSKTKNNGFKYPHYLVAIGPKLRLRSIRLTICVYTGSIHFDTKQLALHACWIYPVTLLLSQTLPASLVAGGAPVGPSPRVAPIRSKYVYTNITWGMRQNSITKRLFLQWTWCCWPTCIILIILERLPFHKIKRNKII